jgi:uncharacterized membrane protein HdeD (DUF308 family)
MADAVVIKPSLGSTFRAIRGKWGWFVALGVGQLILGGIASVNLLAASLASVLVIGAAILVGGIFQIVHAFSARNIRGFLFLMFSGLVYAAAGAIIFYDPVLASLTLSLLVGALILASGILRVWAGFHYRPATGWRWIVAGGIVTFCVGVILVAIWPGIGLSLLGAMLVVDLIFQGWGFVAFGIALKRRASRHKGQHAPV